MAKAVIGRRLCIKNVVSWSMTLCSLTYLYRFTQNHIPEDTVLGTINITQHFLSFWRNIGVFRKWWSVLSLTEIIHAQITYHF